MPTFNKLLFLCTGNYYRSRFAEYLFNTLASKASQTAAQNLKWIADSRGLAIEYGIHNIGTLSHHARRGLIERGITIPAMERFPLPAVENDFKTANKIIALDESEHRPLMAQRFVNWVETIEYWQIHDLDKTSPPIALRQIEQQVQQLIERLLEH